MLNDRVVAGRAVTATRPMSSMDWMTVLEQRWVERLSLLLQLLTADLAAAQRLADAGAVAEPVRGLLSTQFLI